MIFKNNNVSVRIVRRLVLKRFYFGEYVSWQWRKPIFGRKFEFRKRMNPHIAIVGESGGGKSNACRLLMKELSDKGAKILALDPNSDYLGIADSIGAEVYDASRNGINLFDLDGMSENQRIIEIMGIFRKRLKLGYVQASMLKRCIEYTYWVMKRQNKVPVLRDLLYTIKVFQRKSSGSELRMLGMLSERLSLLNGSQFSKTTDMEKALSGNSIFLLSSLHTDEAQSIYMEGLLRKVYSMMLGSGYQKSQRYIVIDEAKKLSESQVLGRLTAEGRKYGIGIITVSQRARETDRDVLANSSVVISFYQREPGELNYIANFIAGGNELNRFVEIKKAIRNLRVGQAIVLDSSEREPFIVEFGLAPTKATSLKYHIESISHKGIRREELMKRTTEMGFDQEIVSSAIDGLVYEKILEKHEISSGQMKGEWYIASPRNSAEHDIYVSLISGKLSEAGITNEIYNSSYGPDVIAHVNGERVAFEYETGTKSREQLRGMLDYRKKSYNRIIVIVNDSNYEKYMGIEGITRITASEFFQSSIESSLNSGR